MPFMLFALAALLRLILVLLAALVLTTLMLAGLMLAGLMLAGLVLAGLVLARLLAARLAGFAPPDLLRILTALVAGVVAVHGRIAGRPVAFVALWGRRGCWAGVLVRALLVRGTLLTNLHLLAVFALVAALGSMTSHFVCHKFPLETCFFRTSAVRERGSAG